MVRLLMQRGADARKGVWPHRAATKALVIAQDRGYDDMGSIFGLAGRIILAVSSLALALLVVTGILIWVKKQDWMNSARKTSGIELTAASKENLEISGG